jgi:uncharacterized membrane protein
MVHNPEKTYWHHEKPDSKQEIITITLWPYRSLGSSGYLYLMMGFIGFLGIEIGLVWLVFRMNYNAGRNFEQISITPEATAVEKVGWRGDKRHFNIPSPWIKASCIKGEGRSDKLILKYHSEQLEIGSFLPPREKSSLADALNESFERMRGAA